MIYYANLLSPSMRRVWIEITKLSRVRTAAASPSMRRVWIEINMSKDDIDKAVVTLHAEGVD